MSERLDLAASRAAADEAISQIDQSANKDWKDVALFAVRVVAEALPEFTTDVVVSVMPDGVEVHDNRAWGPVMRRAARLGYIRKTDRVSTTRRPSNHARPLAVWESLLR